MSKVSDYVIRQLAATGFTVIDHVIARQLTHDQIWATANNALGDFIQAERKIREFLGTLGVSILEVKFSARDSWLMVATRCEEELARRITWITGLQVEGLRPFVPRREIPDAALTAGKEDAPPEHFCAARTAWFEKRGLIDPRLPKKPAPVPFSEFDGRGRR
jgi:hypothetical protein